MDLEQLQLMGLVHANPLLKRTIKVRYFPLLPKAQWADQDVEERSTEAADGEVIVYLRKLTAADQIMVRNAMIAKRDPMYVILHRSVFNEKGGRLFASEEEAMGLDLTMFSGLIVEINKLNDTGKKATPKAKSGSNLPSPLGEEASQNGKSPSPPTNSPAGSNTAAAPDP
jgi:hypothetical protein